jgi:hypothetical protein
MIHLAERIPTRSLQRRMRLGKVVAARNAAWPRPGWCPIFLKAYAIVADRRPTLRQLYRPFPWPHLYEHPDNVASVAIARDCDHEEAVFFAPIHAPEKLGLLEIDTLLDQFKHRPLRTIDAFRRTIRLARLPRPLRRMLLWLAFHGPGGYLAKRLGTFGINVVASMGACGLEVYSPWSSALHYDVIEADGSVDVRLAYDHRVRDAKTVAAILADLEDVLNSEIVNELGYMQALEAA